MTRNAALRADVTWRIGPNSDRLSILRGAAIAAWYLEWADNVPPGARDWLILVYVDREPPSDDWAESLDDGSGGALGCAVRDFS